MHLQFFLRRKLSSLLRSEKIIDRRSPSKNVKPRIPFGMTLRDLFQSRCTKPPFSLAFWKHTSRRPASREQRRFKKQSLTTKDRECSTTRTIVRMNRRGLCARAFTRIPRGPLQHDEEDEEEDTVEGVAVSKGETVRDLQNQKTHVQSSEALAYLARFLFNFASLRRFSIS